MTRVLLPVVALVLAIAAIGLPAAAAADPAVDSSAVVPDYPRAITFTLTASDTAEITDVTLTYALTGRSASAIARPEEFEPGTTVNVEIKVDTNAGASFIPVGSEFVYRWEITSADGSVTITPEQKYVHLPPDKEWKTVANDFMSVYYHGDRESLARAYLDAGTSTYDRIGRDLLQTELIQVPVKVILFAAEEEMAAAQQGRGSTYDAATVTCGTKHTNDIVYVIPVPCGSPDRTDTLRHEFGHILNETAGEGALAKLPSWLDEGTAVYAQSSPGDYEQAFLAAARSGRLIPFNQLGTPSNDPALVGVFYGQSWAMVNYLVEKGGPEDFATFFATIKSGTRFDQALQEVYGFDLAGFEKEFLEAVGAPQAQPTAAPTQRPREAEPTAAPTQRAQATNSNKDDGLSVATFAIFGVAVVFALLGVLAFLVSLMLQNNRMHRARELASPEPGDATAYQGDDEPQ
ncbi:MAG: peptidase MA family metallohydrolase [Dehalococcoidia bacterium]|nr:peptidase MA family metallohydrolase [Dehalococcoidia bacterium]